MSDHPRQQPDAALSARRSIAGKRYWSQLSPRVRNAKVALLVGLWEVPGNRERQSNTMSYNWRVYKHDSIYEQRTRDLMEALRAASDL
jgi:hypothetical protein